MKVIGLTGGIASGKTTVSQLFSQLDVPVIDLDVIARQIVEPGQPALAKVVREFGEDILTPKGNLDRRQLREIIFNQEDKKRLLESLLHPVIWQTSREQIARLDSPYCLLVIPLLTDRTPAVSLDRILVVDIPENEQIRRLMERDRISQEQAEKIINSQLRRKARLALADDVVDNSGNTADLEKQVNRLHEKYLAMARQ